MSEVATVDGQNLASDVGCGWRSKENHRTGNFFGIPPTTKRGSFSQPSDDFFVRDQVCVGFGCEKAGGNTIDGYTELSEFGGKGPGERFEAPLGGRIGRVARAGDRAGDRRD